MKRYLGIIKNEFMTTLAYREYLFTTVIGTFCYYLVLYFLWHAIFKSNAGEIKGMNFSQTFVYLVFAGAIARCVGGWIEWEMHFDMIEGNTIMKLIKPIDYQLLMFANKVGSGLPSLVCFGIPTFIIMKFIFPNEIPLGINTLCFCLTLMLSVVIMFCIEFIVGTVAFYTESVWGLAMIKEVSMGFFSGVTVPLAFFPDKLYTVATFLPFKSICNDPLSVLLNDHLTLIEFSKVVGFQLMWIVILFVFSKLLYQKMMKNIIVNGG